MRTVSLEEARRIAVRSQLLDGSARGVLSTVRRLGFLQLDPISTVAPPQHLVLWSRLGAFDTAELDRLLWKERKLVEWNAFVYPIETLPLLRARMRKPRWTPGWAARVREFKRENAALRRHILRELEARGPLLSRDLDHELRVRRERPERDQQDECEFLSKVHSNTSVVGLRSVRSGFPLVTAHGQNASRVAGRPHDSPVTSH